MLELLEAAADQLGVKVSYETLQSAAIQSVSSSRGGLCRVKGASGMVWRVIVDKRASNDERLTTLAVALAGFDTTELELPQKVRDLLRLYARTRRSAPRELDCGGASAPDRRLRALWILLALAACEKSTNRALDLDLVRITSDAKLRTDTVGEGAFVETATFVLVDAENTGHDGAYITLGGELQDAQGSLVSDFKPQSLWIPAGEARTYALVDRARKPRPTAAAAKIVIRSATIPESPPPAHVDQIRELDDNGKLVVQGVLTNDARRKGDVMVIASFHGPDGRPMTRPFDVISIDAHATKTVQFVSPPGAKRGTIYVGDMTF